MDRNDTAATRASRIVFVEGNVDGTVGGSYFSLFYLVSRLDRRCFEPVVIFASDNDLVPRFQAAGIPVVIRRPASPISFGHGPMRIVAKFLNFMLGWLLEPARLAVLLRRQRASLLHLNNSITRNDSWIVAALLARVPCITHERGINDEFLPRSRLLARSLLAIVCISEAVRQNMVAQGLAHLPLLTIHNGLDVQAMHVSKSPAEVRAELGLKSDARLVGMVGNIRRWKGQEIAVRAIARLRSRFPNVVCLLIGDTAEADRDYDVRLRKLIAELDLGDQVIFTGYRKNISDYVNALEIQIHASIEPEPFGRVLLEAMALSKPLVASRDGAVPEIVQDGVTGLHFEPGNPDSLAECLETLLTDPALAARMGEMGRRRLDERFTIEQSAREVESLYARLGF